MLGGHFNYVNVIIITEFEPEQASAKEMQILHHEDLDGPGLHQRVSKGSLEAPKKR